MVGVETAMIELRFSDGVLRQFGRVLEAVQEEVVVQLATGAEVVTVREGAIVVDREGNGMFSLRLKDEEPM